MTSPYSLIAPSVCLVYKFSTVQKREKKIRSQLNTFFGVKQFSYSIRFAALQIELNKARLNAQLSLSE
jgi:hypothetical protein